MRVVRPVRDSERGELKRGKERPMPLEDLLRGIESIRFEGDPRTLISGLAYHSGQVRPGYLFAAIEGYVRDGHDFVPEALRRGASALLVREGREPSQEVARGVAVISAPDTRRALALLSDRFYRHPSGKLELVGVTGTNGKTTTTFLVERMAEALGLRAGLLGTVRYRIAGKEFPVERTTPESVDLQRLLREMVDAGCEVAAMEVSSHSLFLKRVDGCEFRVAVFTNLTRDHLDFHVDMESYFSAKARLFLPSEKGGLEPKAAVINGDDPWGRRLLRSTEAELLVYGCDEDCDLMGKLLKSDSRGLLVEMKYRGWKGKGWSRMTGSFNLYNLMAAMGVAAVLGWDLNEAFQAVLEFPGVEGRFQKVDEGQDFSVLVDYAHTPDSLQRALEACREMAEGRVLVVFGCGGDRDRGKRPEMGRIAVTGSDLAVITSDNPRSEDPLAIIEDILQGIRDAGAAGEYVVIPDRRDAIVWAVMEAKRGDVVLIAGKGHERYQVFADRALPFDDALEASRALRMRASKTEG